MTRRIPWTAWLLPVFALAFALRAGHVVAVLGSPLGDTLVQDSAYYEQEARSILGGSGDESTGGVTFMNVGYPYALAALYKIFGIGVPAVVWIQSLLGSLSAVLLALATRRLLGSDVGGILAGLLYAVYAGAVHYDGLLLTPSMTNACLVLAFYGVTTHLRDGPRWQLVVAGLAVGASALLRANMLLLIPFLLLVPLLGRRPGTVRDGLRPAILLGASALLLPMSVVLWNGVSHGEWVPVSGNGGMNFWVGNHRGAQGVYVPAGFIRSQSAAGEEWGFLEEARRRSGDPALSLAGSSSFWLRQGLREVREAPGRWLGIEWRKFALFWNRFEVNTNVGLEFAGRFSPVLGYLTLGFSWLAVLGIGGIVRLWTEDRAAAWLVSSLALVPLLTCLLFFVSGEYRHPASLALCVGAAAALEMLWRVVARRPAGEGAPRSRPALVYPLMASAVVLPFALWSYPQLENGCHPRYDARNFAREIGSGDLPRAERVLDRIRAGDPDDLVLLEARSWLHYDRAPLHGGSRRGGRRPGVAERARETRSPGGPGHVHGVLCLRTVRRRPGSGGGPGEAGYRSAERRLATRAGAARRPALRPRPRPSCVRGTCAVRTSS